MGARLWNLTQLTGVHNGVGPCTKAKPSMSHSKWKKSLDISNRMIALPNPRCTLLFARCGEIVVVISRSRSLTGELFGTPKRSAKGSRKFAGQREVARSPLEIKLLHAGAEGLVLVLPAVPEGY